jgi:hypothetical protein
MSACVYLEVFMSTKNEEGVWIRSDGKPDPRKGVKVLSTGEAIEAYLRRIRVRRLLRAGVHTTRSEVLAVREHGFESGCWLLV